MNKSELQTALNVANIPFREDNTNAELEDLLSAGTATPPGPSDLEEEEEEFEEEEEISFIEDDDDRTEAIADTCRLLEEMAEAEENIRKQRERIGKFLSVNNPAPKQASLNQCVKQLQSIVKSRQGADRKKKKPSRTPMPLV